MSNLFGPISYNNYHYNQKRDNPYKVLGITYDPYQPKISSQVTQEKYNQALTKTLSRGITPQKQQIPYDNSYDKKIGKRSNSTAPLINNSYNIINNNPYCRSPNYNTYINGYSNNRDHVKDLLNLTGRDTISFYKPNNKQNYSRQNQFNDPSIVNKKKLINNYETEKNAINEFNYKNEKEYSHINYNKNYNNNYNDNNNLDNKNNSKLTIEEKISNDSLEEYFEENCGDLIKNFAYKEKPNSRFRDYMEDKGKSILNFNSNPDNALFCLFDGHGGGEVSKYLQENFPKFMKEILPINNENAEIKLNNLFLKLDNKIKESNFYQVGSTACIIYITKEKEKKILYCANVGDTRCTLIKELESKRLSYDDRASDENEYNRIIKQGGIVFGGRVYGQLMLSRAFGDWELKNYGVSCEPHITRINIEDNDKYVIVATDGVWDVLEDEDVYRLSKDANNSMDLCRNIINISLEKGTMDNISCFVVALN